MSPTLCLSVDVHACIGWLVGRCLVSLMILLYVPVHAVSNHTSQASQSPASDMAWLSHSLADASQRVKRQQR